MASHSSTLAWKIPWMEEPGRLQSMGLLRVGHDWATSIFLWKNISKVNSTGFLGWREREDVPKGRSCKRKVGKVPASVAEPEQGRLPSPTFKRGEKGQKDEIAALRMSLRSPRTLEVEQACHLDVGDTGVPSSKCACLGSPHLFGVPSDVACRHGILVLALHNPLL